MSGRLKITFAPDMPPASVEVVAPDFSTVDRVWLCAGDNKEVDVPSEGSFLRVHLASGESVTLKDPGNLNRTIGLSDILSSRRQRSSVDPVAARAAKQPPRRAASRGGAGRGAVRKSGRRRGRSTSSSKADSRSLSSMTTQRSGRTERCARRKPRWCSGRPGSTGDTC